MALLCMRSGHWWHNAKLDIRFYYRPICGACSHVSTGLNMIKTTQSVFYCSCVWLAGFWNMDPICLGILHKLVPWYYSGCCAVTYLPGYYYCCLKPRWPPLHQSPMPLNRRSSLGGWYLLTHPLSLSADCVANDICPVRCACRREHGGLPADL